MIFLCILALIVAAILGLSWRSERVAHKETAYQLNEVQLHRDGLRNKLAEATKSADDWKRTAQRLNGPNFYRQPSDAKSPSCGVIEAGAIGNAVGIAPMTRQEWTPSALDVKVGALSIKATGDQDGPRLGCPCQIELDGKPVERVTSLTLKIAPDQIIRAEVELLP
jgi:hypothetical protein